MGTSSENFCLRWNDFESNVSGAFRDLRAESDFFDVTLGCAETGKSLQAHKVILSACSSTFKQMLRDQARSSPHPHPYIFLRGVSFCDLSAVLDFMYHGEVNVAQEDLNSFLAVAEELQIKGLTQKEGGEPSKPTPKASKRPNPSPAPSGSAVKQSRRSSPAPAAAAAEAEEVKAINIKSDPEAGPSGSQAVSGGASGSGGAGSEYADESADFEDYGDYYGDDNGEGGAGADGSMMEGGEDGAGGKEQEPEGIAKVDGKFVCMLCGYKSIKRNHAMTHYRTQHMTQQPVACHVCQKVFKNSVYRDRHRSQTHGITKKMMKEAVRKPIVPVPLFQDQSD